MIGCGLVLPVTLMSITIGIPCWPRSGIGTTNTYLPVTDWPTATVPVAGASSPLSGESSLHALFASVTVTVFESIETGLLLLLVKVKVN